MKRVIRWKVVLYLTAIFITGSVSGWVVATRAAKDKAFTPPKSNEIAASLRDRIHSKLNLTPDQAKQVDVIIERSSKQIQSVNWDCIKRIRQGISSRNAQINALLTPEQQKLFEEIEKDRRSPWRNKEGRRPRSSKGRDRDENAAPRGGGLDWNDLKRPGTNSIPEGQQQKSE
ncbi:MAG TPA: hypothetical protein VK633_07080 [Verrucomicrobiae bacterium]|nr:hypothetical protein [Verrucomicrobiae bacterium]